jgi:peptidoglycan/xylan/chitin deacetylase (PgdA/CDA1 family)
MASFRAGFVAAAVATAVALPLAVTLARAQDPTADQIQVQAKDQFGAADQSQTADQTTDQTTDQVQSQAANAAQACPGNPDALGTSRVLPIDFSQHQQLGRMQYPDSLPLDDKEVVLTFDDGPLPPSTDKVLDTLAAQCVKATFFMVGEMARAFPATVRRVYEEGHTIGTHSDHHPMGFGKLPLERMRAEIDGGIADVSAAFGGDSRYLAPFFRIPGFARSDLVESELAERELIVFSADVVADDWHRGITPAKIISLAMSRLEARGKGILLLHDIHPKTAAALPGLLEQLKANGFHIVQVVPSASYEMAMAHRPAAQILASAVPGELTIDEESQPAWPQTADKSMPDDIVLPVPNPSAFEPDTVLNDENAAVQWPDIPKSATTANAATPRGQHRRLTERSERRGTHVVRAADHDHVERQQRPHHARARARAGADGHHADLISRIHAFAALFSPARTTQ